jgi:uncharacterized protein (DUF2147 family)
MLLSSVLCAAQADSHDSPLEGVWLHSNKRILVEIAPCGEHFCGRIVWLKNPNDEMGEPRSDLGNPDPSQRGRLVMGMTVIRGLVRSGSGVWSDGTIYNPADGETYSARVTLVDPDTLRVRAYKFLPLFGETQIWTRSRD